MLFVLEQAQPGVRSDIGVRRLGAHEAGRQHHPVAEHETVEGQVVAEDLSAPGSLCDGVPN
ncbi:hypothetical protein, partial [Methylobacterium crusticola]|uniref:hypothetical protein n=1 Tax=Methylobacterium crusticola TaxID=1697972 RepID=UPI001EE17E14